MKKAVFSLFLTGSLVFGFQTLDAQVYKIAEAALYYPGGVSDDGVVSLVKGNVIYKWDQTNGLVPIGSQTNPGTISGKITISRDGQKISGNNTNPVSGKNEISLYDVASQTWQSLGGIAATGSGNDLSSAWGMSPDGTVLVGLGYIGSSAAHAVKWTAGTGMVDLGTAITGAYSRANSVSGANSTIVGWQDQASGDRTGARWINGVYEAIKDNEGNFVGEANGVSEDGKTVAGGNFGQPYVWNETTGYIGITYPADPQFSGACTAISADGKTAVGYFRGFGGAPFGGDGFIWTEATGRVSLNDYVTSLGFDSQGISFGLPLAISQDGKKIVGTGLKTGTFQAAAFLIDLTTVLAAQDVSKTKISIAPNPVKEFFTISGGKIDHAEIYNVTGQKMKSLKIVNGKADVSYLSNGIYILNVVSEGKKQNIKFIKE